MPRTAVKHRYYQLYDVTRIKIISEKLNKKMLSAPLALAILLANAILSRSDCELSSEVKSLEVGPAKSVFTLQIQQIRTTDETVATSAGNNLNIFDAAVTSNSLDVQENFRTISTVYPLRETNVDEKIKSDQDGGGSKLLSLEENFRERKSGLENDKAYNLKQSMNLVENNCFDTTYREYNSKGTTSKDESTYSDVNYSKNIEIENINSAGNNLNKRNSHNSDSTSTLREWLGKYNIFRSLTDQESLTTDDNIETLTTMTPISEIASISDTMPIVPITTNISDDFSSLINVTLQVISGDTANTIEDTDVGFHTTKDNDKIKFSSLPQTQTYLIPKFRLDDGIHPFTFMSKFFSVIYFSDYPIGKACNELIMIT